MRMMINTNSFTFLQIYLFLILMLCVGHSELAGNGAYCRESEQIALLQFKAELIDDYGRLSSWGSITNCCGWKGVVCDNRTNHVIALHLHGPNVASDHQFSRSFGNPVWISYPAAPLRGKISPSLLQLPHLQHLDLSLNDFNGTKIPSFIGSFTKLRHLSLSYSNFGGQIPHHIGNLSVLQLLDLRGNRFLTDTNLDWLSGSPSLQYLDLSHARLNGWTAWLQVIHKLTALKELHLSSCDLAVVVPVSLNSSSNSLVVLDLSFNDFPDSSAVLRTFLNMSSSFTYIDFSGNSFIKGGIPDALGNLVSLSHLRLQSCNLNTSLPDFLLGNLTSLSYLDLFDNDLHGEFPQHSKNSSSLTYLDLSFNRLNGQLSHLVTWLWDSTNLQYLSLSENVLSGSFPNMSRFPVLIELQLEYSGLSGALLQGNLRLPNLEFLDLSENKFTGRLPNLSSSPLLRLLDLIDNSFSGNLIESIGQLSKIEYLMVGYNELEGVITETHLSSLPHLRLLDLSFNLDISIRTSPSWIPPVQFRELLLACCKLGPQFPEWLRTQNQLKFLDISNSGIIDTIPSWFWGNLQVCFYLNMSHNQIRGVLPDLSSTFTQLNTIDLSCNEFTGSLPPLPPFLEGIDLSRNRFSGTLILNFCNFKESDLFLDVSNNQLSGEIPQDCFRNLLSLGYLNLANNNFSGEIPTTNNLICHVSSLHLRNNSFRGEIPRSLMNCSKLRILDLGGNEFIGRIPVWLGEGIPELGVLILKSNNFYGSLPPSLCHLANIQVLDISSNKITGTIPRCLNNFTRLTSPVDPGAWKYLFYSIRNGAYDDIFYDSASVIWKGHEETYINTLGLLKMIDLSSNELSGEIHPELTSLIGVVGLNLSRNNLVGVIPKEIDELRNLNFLDLSRNNLSGSIPPTLSKLSHLGVLDLSFNNLWGRIPWDSHLQTFEASSFSGNPRLCGPPLLWRPCPEDEKPGNGSDDSEEKFINRGFYISLLLGFILAFWVVFWTSFFNKWWNVWSMRICMAVADWLYVHLLVNKRRLMMRFLGNA